MIYYADMSRGPGGICHLEVSWIGSSTCLDVRVGFVALNVSGVFDVVFVVMEVSKGLLGVGFAIMVSRHLIEICYVDIVSSLTMLFVGGTRSD